MADDVARWAEQAADVVCSMDTLSRERSCRAGRAAGSNVLSRATAWDDPPSFTGVIRRFFSDHCTIRQQRTHPGHGDQGADRKRGQA
jgi:hypothetical protein